ncbi:hypothetical protein DV737_g5053, partial [Chaetothyriales sp. CBS 132003]
MLKLSTPINSIRPALMPSFEPGIQFALDLTDSIPDVSSRNELPQPKANDIATYQGPEGPAELSTSLRHGQPDSSSRQLPDDLGMHVRRQSQESYAYQSESPVSRTYTEYDAEINSRHSPEIGRNAARYNTRRRPFNQDEFDGPNQLLPLPVPPQELARSQDLPSLPVHLSLQEQDEIMQRANYILSQCAYHFVAKYQFPIPLERDKPRVCGPADREWTEWAYLLKRLATKRRIPARVLFENQIKQFVTTLENSIAARPARDNQNRSPKDDRYILQLVSAGTQVAKIVMDSEAMEQLDQLYQNTEGVILERRAREMTVGYR